MTEEKKKILDKVNALIEKRKEELLQKLPIVHEVSDAIIIRFFSKWDNCDTNEEIKYKKIVNKNNPKEKIILFYIPKGVNLEFQKRDFIHTITCINGILELDVNGKLMFVTELEKVTLDTDEWQGRALENTYAVTTN
jgi:hypothetical protein